MQDQNVLDAAANAELDHLIATTMQLMSASSAYDLKPRDQTGNTTLFGEYRIDNKNRWCPDLDRIIKIEKLVPIPLMVRQTFQHCRCISFSQLIHKVPIKMK
ncbi:MAG: hypothetical protein KAR85_03580, partial [Methanosarcinales archaeon]|nr:hypothetical protein [Methanosarcinales archaeon]